MSKGPEDEALDALMKEQEDKESEEMFKPSEPSVQVIVNIGGHPEPDGDEGSETPEEEKAELAKLTGGK